MNKSTMNIKDSQFQVFDKSSLTNEVIELKDHSVQGTVKSQVENLNDENHNWKDYTVKKTIKEISSEGEILSDVDNSKSQYEDLSSDSEDFDEIIKIENSLTSKRLKEKNKKKLLNYSTSKTTKGSSPELSKFPKHNYYYSSHRGSSKTRMRNGNKFEKSLYYNDKNAWLRDPHHKYERSPYKRNESCDFSNKKYKKRKISNEEYSSKNPNKGSTKKRKKARDYDKSEKQFLKRNHKKKSYSGNENKFPNDVRKKRRFKGSSASSSDESTTNRTKKKKREYMAANPPPVSLWKRLNLKTPVKLNKNENNNSNDKSVNVENIQNKLLDKPVSETEPNKDVLNGACSSSLGNTNFFKINNCNTTELTTETVITPALPTSIQPDQPMESISSSSEELHNLSVDLQSLHIPFPTLSVDNFPLTPGPNKLPVYITPTGEQIPYDMAGRKIPIGPYGHNLPLDSTGRLFAHVVSQNNEAIPVHMTEDGVIRLPDSKPIPFGPPYKLPVNVDGSIILIGPDSKPLFPCPNLPKYPLSLLLLENSMQPPIIRFHQTEDINDYQSQNNYPKKDFSITNFTNTLQTDYSETNSIENHEKKEIKGQNALKKCNEPKRNLTNRNSDTTNFLVDSISSGPLGTPKSVKSDCGSPTHRSDSDEEGALKIDSDAISDSEKESVYSKILKDKIINIEQAIKSLRDENYVPAKFGRFIIRNSSPELFDVSFPDESPLLRNQRKLPYISPAAKVLLDNDSSRNGPSFDFSANEKKTTFSDKVCTLDFAVQCDLTSKIFKELNDKITQKNEEIIRLQNENAKLLSTHQDFLLIHKRNTKY